MICASGVYNMSPKFAQHPHAVCKLSKWFLPGTSTQGKVNIPGY